MPALLWTGLLALTLASGWWGIVRAADLLARYDNPRRSIADRYVPRGSLLDRRNMPISYSEGSPGTYQRVYAYPELSPVIGYTHSIYGQAGLEAQLDSYLRGLSGYPSSQIWWQHLLNGYPPPGLDVRLSIDLTLQAQADRLLGNAKGALVLVNAETGEILAMASHPNFDANQLDDIGAELSSMPDSPLFNRASQGQYTVGTALGPFLLAELFEAGLDLPPFSSSLLLQQNGQLIRCTLRNEQAPDWENALPAGCPQPLLTLAKVIGPEKITNLFRKLAMGFTDNDLESLSIGQTVSVTPLTMALAASALSNDGIAPTAQMPLAVNIPNQGWVILQPEGEPKTVFSAEAANRAAQLLQVEGRPYWESMGRFSSQANPLIWYLGGTLPGWQGTPLAIVVVVETDNPFWARDAGRGVLDFAIQP
jgi:peptidoglycan glycosyltransferase